MDINKRFFYSEGGEILEQVAHSRCGCHIIGSVQSQVGCDFEETGLAKDAPADVKDDRDGLDDL